MRDSLTPLPKRHEARAPGPGAVARLSERVRLGEPHVDSRWAAPRSRVRPRTLMLALMLAQLLGTLATSAAASGQYKELLAEFASAGDVMMNIDSSGKFFFQSANSGCVGNGALVPHLDGAADTYDVTLMMENCNDTYAYLNGQYGGLALYTSSSYWDYDSLLRMWLSKPTGGTPPAALTTLGEPL
jgi:hypothetical protein